MNGLGRLPEFDIRSRDYPIRPLLASALPLTSKTWACNTYLNQGNVGACVGFAWAHEIAASPVVGPADYGFAMYIYHEAQKIDAWPGEDYEGTSVLAGAKMIQKLGWMKEYRWAFGMQDVLDTVSHYGPVILGINWREGMWRTDSSGFIHATGSIVGGHAILLLGINVESKYVILHNSWGQGWGMSGRAKLSFSDLDLLLENSGEACVPVDRIDPNIDPMATFKDVPSTHPHYSAIEWLAKTGITKGINPPVNDLFGPDVQLTRAQMATFLKRFFDYLNK